MTDQQESEAGKQRAHYSTSWPDGSTGPVPAGYSSAGTSRSGVLSLSANQWTALVFFVVIVFVLVALATGVVVGRVLRGPMAVRASTVEPPSPAVSTNTQPSSLQTTDRVDPRPESGAGDSGLSALLNQALVVGDRAPEFSLETPDGGRLGLSQLRGRTVLVNFWATWCTWCKYELPALQAAYEKYRDKGLVVVGVDVQEPKSLVDAYIERYSLAFPVVLDIEGTAAEAYHVYGLPMTYFVDPDGVIVHVQRGAMREDELELHVRNALFSESE